MKRLVLAFSMLSAFAAAAPAFADCAGMASSSTTSPTTTASSGTPSTQHKGG